MKKALALILACVLALAILPAVAEEVYVTGDWYAELGGLPVQLTLAEDGTYSLTLPGSDPAAGTWVLKNGYIYMDGASTPDMATIGESSLIMSDGATVFTREKVEGYALADLKADADLVAFAGYWQAVYVDVNGAPISAEALADETDLYVEGTHAILGGPIFGDTIVEMAFADGAMTCESEGAKVQLQLQQDGLLRLSVSAADAEAQAFYLAKAYSAALDEGR